MFSACVEEFGVTGFLHFVHADYQKSLIFHSDLNGEENVGAFCLLGVLKIRLFFFHFIFSMMTFLKLEQFSLLSKN